MLQGPFLLRVELQLGEHVHPVFYVGSGIQIYWAIFPALNLKKKNYLEAGSLVAQAGLESKNNLKLLILLPPPLKSVF